MRSKEFNNNILLPMLIIAIGLKFYDLFVATRVWQYVAVPLGAPSIGMKAAFGLGLIVCSLYRIPTSNLKKTPEELARMVATDFLSTSFLWLMAYAFFS